ncbi:MAG: putative sulfate exporter family transporter [Phycisphaerales bacterium]|nr:putative sulfate exporter family transporter [Phycisphaerales bacterium]
MWERFACFAARLWKPTLFVAAVIAVSGPWSRSDIALAAGIALGLGGLAAFTKESKVASKWLIQGCVVALGLRLDLTVLAASAVDGLALAVGTIVGAVALGLLFGKIFKTGREVSILVTSGTAICGGSAIVAVGSSIGAASSSMAVATGAIFALNAIGLWTLPAIGHSLGLSQEQFGQWAGVALHDIASVGGASTSYGAIAFDTATIVKLTRVIWIFPLAILAGRLMRGSSPSAPTPVFPWFILLFVVASGVRTLVPQLKSIEEPVLDASATGFQCALFLIGTGLTRTVIRQVGWRAFAQATLLWIIVAGTSLGIIYSMRH